MGNNLTSFLSGLFGGVKGREDKDTLSLHREAAINSHSSPFSNDEKATDFMYALAKEACELRHGEPVSELGEALYSAVADLLFEDGFFIRIPDENWIANLTLEEGVNIRKIFQRNKRFVAQHQYLLPPWRKKVLGMYSIILDSFPLSAFEERRFSGPELR